MIRHYRIRPLDTFFFRDGRPFEQEDEGMADIRSLFPPYPPMLTGAFRAAVARAMGWDGRDDWDESIKAVLGDGPDCTGKLVFGPPVLLREGADGPEALYPAPRHLLRAGSGRSFHLLRPAGKSLRTDAGELPLPESREEGLKDCGGCWLDATDFARLLAGRLPQRLIPSDELWTLEYRVGLQRHVAKRTAVRGMLYAVSQVRLSDGVRAVGGGATGSAAKVSLGLAVEAGDAGPPDPEPLGPAGGFRRIATFDRLQKPWREAGEPAPPADGRYIVVLLSPARFSDLSWNRPGGTVPGLPGTLVFACTDRPVMIGGWDGRSGRRGPVALRAHLPAGSVLFLEGDRDGVAALFRDRSRRSIGEAATAGFGRFVLGHWPQQGS